MIPGSGPGAILDASEVIWDRLGIHLEVPKEVSGFVLVEEGANATGVSSGSAAVLACLLGKEAGWLVLQNGND